MSMIAPRRPRGGRRARRRATFAAALAVLGCAGPLRGPPPVSVPAAWHAPEGGAADTGTINVDPRAVGMLVFLQVELPEAGAVIGGEFDGIQFDRQVSTLRMSEGLRERWMDEARGTGDSVLRAAGYLVHEPLAPSSDAAPLRGVRFGLSAVVTKLNLSAAARADLRARAHVEVIWELIDLAAGAPVFEGRTDGMVRNRDSLDQALTGAVARALAQLLEDRQFLRALAAPRSVTAQSLVFAEFARPLPLAHDTILIEPGPRTPSEGASALAGVVAVHGVRGFRATAFLIEGAGLALAGAGVARQTWLWAELSDGSKRAVRVLRVDGELALLELACLEGCPTVAWVPMTALTDRLAVFVITPLPLGIAHRQTTVRERRVAGAAQWSTRLRRRPLGGEAIVRMTDGVVVAVATPTRLVPLAEVLRALGVVVIKE